MNDFDEPIRDEIGWCRRNFLQSADDPTAFFSQLIIPDTQSQELFCLYKLLQLRLEWTSFKDVILSTNFQRRKSALGV
jgi:hypothetical protein